MVRPAPQDPPAKFRHKGRRMLFILLSLALLGLIGLGSLQVFQLVEQSGTTGDAPSNSSAAFSDDISSEADANTEETQTPSLASKENKKPDPESQAAKMDIGESERNSAGEQPDLSISGAVLDDTGNLLPGISVVARPEQGQTGVRINAGELRQQTDQLGSFTFDNLVEGEYDHLPEAAFYMVGTIEEAVEKAQKLAEAA